MLGPLFSRITHDLSPNLNAPRMSRIYLGNGIASCATGYDSLVSVRSAGEAIERHLSYCDSEYNYKKATISELENNIAQWFCDTLPDHVSANIDGKHRYNVIKVKELISKKYFIAPLVAFTLGKNEDDDFHGFRDSSGTALYNSPLQALENARNEYCERQALSLFWYYGHCLSYAQLKIDTIEQFLKPYPLFLHYLLTKGNVYLFDISLIHPVRTFLAVFLSTKEPVYFSAGASGCEDATFSIYKSLIELYQAYILMLNISRKQKNIIFDDVLMKGYLSYNNPLSYDKWQFIFNRQSLKTDNFPRIISFSKSFVKEKILSFEKRIFFRKQQKTFISMY